MTSLVTRAPQETRGSWKTYLGLVVVLIFSAFPVYWMFVIATSTDAAVSQIPPSVIPGGELFNNLNEVFTMQEVYFTASLINSVIVSGVITTATLFFCSLAGFAFAKLRFPARNALMFVVILTLTVPNQLGVVALYILMGKLGWNGTLLAVIAPGLVSAFGVFYMRQFIAHAVPDAEETISYGMPAFRRGGRFFLSFAGWKRHCSIYPLTDTFLAAHRSELEGYGRTKGSLHFTAARPLPDALVEDLVRDLLGRSEGEY